MNSDRWSEVEKLYHAALEREPSERQAFLSVCEDEEVRHEVQSLSSTSKRATGCWRIRSGEAT